MSAKLDEACPECGHGLGEYPYPVGMGIQCSNYNCDYEKEMRPFTPEEKAMYADELEKCDDGNMDYMMSDFGSNKHRDRNDP